MENILDVLVFECAKVGKVVSEVIRWHADIEHHEDQFGEWSVSNIERICLCSLHVYICELDIDYNKYQREFLFFIMQPIQESPLLLLWYATVLGVRETRYFLLI